MINLTGAIANRRAIPRRMELVVNATLTGTRGRSAAPAVSPCAPSVTRANSTVPSVTGNGEACALSQVLPPAVVLGGEVNALSVIRDLGRLGVTVYAIGEGDACTRHSRYCRWIDL